jgi:hypothetical protein
MRCSTLNVSVLLVPLLVSGCFEDPSTNTTASEAGDGDGDPSGDGDGDGMETSDSQGDGDGDMSGDGDGDPTGDGDGDPTGDGDGDPTGDGDGDPTGDGDGDPGPCSDGPYPVVYGGALMLATGPNSRGVAIADVDNDGDLDIVSTSQDAPSVQVFRNNGAGLFGPPVDTEVPNGVFPAQVQAVAIADGIVDVVFTAHNEFAATLLVRMRGAGDGTFTNFQSITVPSFRFDLGHINGDSSLDVVGPGDNIVTVYQSSVGQESFFPPNLIQSPAPFSNASAIVLGDFDDDGDLDVAAAVFGNLIVGDNDGTGVYSFGAPIGFFGGPSDLAVGDVNNDGKLDILLTTLGGGSDAAHLFAGNGDGTFQADLVLTAPSAPMALDVADIDKDGIDDLAVVGSGTMAVYISMGNGTFEAGKQVTCMGFNPRQLHIGDLNGDCVGDVVSVTEDGVCVMLSQ